MAEQILEYKDIRIASMLEAVSAQRNNALNEVVNLAAENAVLKAAFERQSKRLAELEASASSGLID